MGLEQAAAKTRKSKRFGFFGISTFTFRFARPQRIATLSGLPHDEFCAARARDISQAGFEVRLTDWKTPGHTSVIFADQPTEDDINRFIAVFGKPRINRTAKSRSA